MSGRRSTATVAAIFAAGTALLTGGSAYADTPAGVTPQAAPEQSGPRLTQMDDAAKRVDVAKRAGLSADTLSGPFRLVNRHSEKCLTILGANTANNAQAVQYTCDYSYPFNEEWYFDGYHIVNGHSGKCLTVLGANTAENADVVQYTCDNSAPFNENWESGFVCCQYEYWHYFNHHSGKCLTILGANIGNNHKAVQYTCDSAPPYNEEWRLA